jgi:hypothetical protein
MAGQTNVAQQFANIAINAIFSIASMLSNIGNNLKRKNARYLRKRFSGTCAQYWSAQLRRI